MMTPATAVAPIDVKPLSKTPCVFEVVFDPHPARVAGMRRITAAFLRLWGAREALVQNVVLVVSELVTNAIEHGRGDVGLRLRCADGELRVEVTDHNRAPAQLRVVDDDAVRGRGLFLVAALARCWGVSEDGMITWATWLLPTRSVLPLEETPCMPDPTGERSSRSTSRQRGGVFQGRVPASRTARDDG